MISDTSVIQKDENFETSTLVAYENIMLQDVYYEQKTNQALSETTEYYQNYENKSTTSNSYDSEQGIFIHW